MAATCTPATGPVHTSAGAGAASGGSSPLLGDEPLSPVVYSLPLRLKFRKDGERRSWKAERCPGPQRWAPRALPESDAR